MNQALQDVIEHRRTTNVFEPNHTISDEQIEHLVHLATPQMQRDEAIRSATFGAGSLLYAAEVHGFGSCPMIGFDPVAVASEFSLLPDEIPVLLVAIGRAATDNWPQKRRRPLTEVLSFA